ncbi:MAG: alpha/beta hydrolase [Gammaproteobacteria bacterium]|nr:MAG: alpha/beta hydrolase [Gammaproteobacteria bacterium]
MFGFVENQMIYYPQPLESQTKAQLSPWEYVIPNGQINLHGWLIGNRNLKSDQIILYFGGNGEEVSFNVEYFNRLSNRKRTYALFNYRSYGESEGLPSEKNLFSDALAIYDHLVEYEGVHPEQIHVMGRSLGSGVAVYLASQRPLQSAVLVTPFDSLTNVVKHLFPLMPVDLLLRQKFESISRAPLLRLPALFLLAGLDKIVPPAHGEALADKWLGQTEIVRLPNADHNNIFVFPEYWQHIEAFWTF